MLPYVLPYFVSAAVASWIVVVLWQRRTAPGVVAFMVLMGAACLWSLTNALEVASTTLETKLFWARVQYLAKVAIPVAWLVTALQYVGRGRSVTMRMIALCSAVPLATLVLVWTSGRHDWLIFDVVLDTTGPVALVGKEYGSWFWVHITYSYALIAFATLQIILALQLSRLFRGQAAAWLIAAAIPAAWNIAYVSGLNLFRGLDLSSAAFAVSGLVLLWGFRRFHLFDLVPAARELVIEAMTEGVVALDAQGRIVDLNPAASRILNLPAASAPGARLEDVVPALGRIANDGRPPTVEPGDSTPAEIELMHGNDKRIYELRISPLMDARQRQRGRLVMLLDVTANRGLQSELRARSLVDDLTGLHNRRGFFSLAEPQLRLALRRKAPATLVFVDLDGLKAVNDSEGHASGDDLLRAAAAVLRRAFRESDILARLGGDEFAVLAVDADGQERLASRIEEALSAHRSSGGRLVSLSVGMATFDPESPEALSELLRKADALMYRHKRMRRTTEPAPDQTDGSLPVENQPAPGIPAISAPRDE